MRVTVGTLNLDLTYWVDNTPWKCALSGCVMLCSGAMYAMGRGGKGSLELGSRRYENDSNGTVQPTQDFENLLQTVC